MHCDDSTVSLCLLISVCQTTFTVRHWCCRHGSLSCQSNSWPAHCDLALPHAVPAVERLQSQTRLNGQFADQLHRSLQPLYHSWGTANIQEDSNWQTSQLKQNTLAACKPSNPSPLLPAGRNHHPKITSSTTRLHWMHERRPIAIDDPVACGITVQTRQNGSRSYLVWRLLVT